MSAGTSGTGRLTALFVVRGAGHRNSVAITATAAAAPPMLTSAAGLRSRRPTVGCVRLDCDLGGLVDVRDGGPPPAPAALRRQRELLVRPP